MLLLLTVIFIVSTLYIVEVHFGSSISVYNCELGKASEMRATTRLSQREFFSRMLPLLLLPLGLTLLCLHQSLGLGLLALAGVTGLGSHPWRSTAKP